MKGKQKGSQDNTYKSSGVDVDRGYEAVALMKEHIQKTHRKEVLSELGGFGGAFSIMAAKEMEKPILVSGTDGVGTKLKIAFLMDIHDSIGIDLVAMSVNDIICSGASPLFFLDYFASGQTDPRVVAQVVKGIAQGCEGAGCALIGGETAEMVGMYQPKEYDLAGFAVGLVDEKNMINNQSVTKGDILIGLESSGLHSNGFSLVRHILDLDEDTIHEIVPSLQKSIGEVLLTPTKIYVKGIMALMEKVTIKGAAHITGGGWHENIPRMLPEGLGAKIKKGSWPISPIFHYLKEMGNLTDDTMWHTFNMGIGMIAVVGKEEVDIAMASLEKSGEKAYIIGKVEPSLNNQVEL